MKKIIIRAVYKELNNSVKKDIITAIIGSRQTGKTTSLQHLISAFRKKTAGFANRHLYLNLDAFSLRENIVNDEEYLQDRIQAVIRQPLTQMKHKFYLFIDEAQKAPKIFEILKILYDKYHQKLKIIITGSSVLEIMGKSSESLAGRIGYIRIFPFSLEEYFHYHQEKDENYNVPSFLEELISGKMTYSKLDWYVQKKSYLKLSYLENIDDIIINGLYPKVIALKQKKDRFKELQNYKDTYIDKDIRQIQKVAELHQFDNLLTILSSRTGQILVRSNLANEACLDTRSALKYLSILEQTFIIYLLQPYFRNTERRVRKSPEIYFYDNGLAALLTKWTNIDILKSTNKIGNLFENLIIGEFIKYIKNRPLPADLYFWKSSNNTEVDLCIESEAGIIPCEVKYSTTPSPKYAAGIKSFINSQKQRIPYGLIIYNGPLCKLAKNIWALPSWLLS